MSEEVDVKQAQFSGFAILELMGHRKEIGFVTTEAYGAAVLFRVDSPSLPEREYVLDSPEYVTVQIGDDGQSSRWAPKGTKVKRSALPARSCLVSPNALYALNPCTEAAAMRAIEVAHPRPLIALELPPDMVAIMPASDSKLDAEFDEDDDAREGDESL